jgi:hypothetical protein
MHIIYFTHPVVTSLDIPLFGKPKRGNILFYFFLTLFAHSEERVDHPLASGVVGVSR